MLYAMKLGPVETGEGEVAFYVGATEAGLVGAVPAIRDIDGLQGLTEIVPEGERLCEARLATAGRLLGFRAAPAPPHAREGRATMALGLAIGDQLAPPPPINEVLLLAQSMTEYWRAAPWRFWHNEHVLAIEVSARRPTRYEGCVLGNGGEEFGLALYSRKGAVARIARAPEPTSLAEAAREPCLSVTLDDEPDFAVRALEEAFGLPAVPVPMKIGRGRVGRVTARELVTLSVALGAVAGITPDRREAIAHVLLGGERVSARVSAPDPHEVA